jgi:hypothetical protein
MWKETLNWKWLRPFVLRSTSLPIEETVALVLLETKNILTTVEEEKENHSNFCETWIKHIRSIPLSDIELSLQRKLIRRIQRGNSLTDQDRSELQELKMSSHADQYITQQHAIKELEEVVRKTFAQEVAALQKQLYHLFRDLRYEKALYTLNQKLWRFHAENDLTKETPSFSDRRQKCRTLFAYLQRVTTKNDTVGEYGPICYGKFGAGTPILNRKIVNRKVFFAHQGLQRLLSLMKEDLGEVTVHWKLPSATIDGLRHLQNYLHFSLDHPLTSVWKGRLDLFEDLANQFGRAETPEIRNQISERANLAYAKITGEIYQGKDQQYFGDKSLLLEECQDQLFLPLIVDDSLWEELDQALLIEAKLLVDAWKCFQEKAREGFEYLAKGKKSITFTKWVMYWMKYPPKLPTISRFHGVEPFLHPEGKGYTAKIPSHILDTWREEVSQFSWLLSPDWMVSGKHSKDGLHATSIVLGELHHGFTADGWMLHFHPDKQEMKREVHDTLTVETDKHRFANWIFKRTMKSTPQEYPGPSVEIKGISAQSNNNVLSLKDLEVRCDGGQVIVVQNGTETPIWFYPPALGFSVDAYFGFGVFCAPMLPLDRKEEWGYQPELRVGRVTLKRESWRFRPKDWIGETVKGDWFEQFKELQEVKKRYELPKSGFIRFSNEQKPIWFDFDNPFCIDLFYNLAKNADWFVFSKMDPGIEDLILEDGGGHYCSEIRTFVTKARKSES